MNRLLRSAGGPILTVLGLLGLLPGCRRKEPPPPVVAAPEQPLAPWAWHKLGGLLVVTGEAAGPLDLVLKGRYLNDRMHAEFGPVRWELYAPPPGEIAELRTQEGELLARWEFDAPVQVPEPVKPPKAPPAARKPKPPKKVVPEPPAVPVTRVWPDTHLPLAQGLAVKPVLVAPAKAATPPLPKVSVPVPPPPPSAPPKVVLRPKPAERPWPDTHLPLVQGASPKPALAQKTSPKAAAPPLPKVSVPVPPPPPSLPPKVALRPRIPERPWPDTHLPLVQGASPKPALAQKAAPKAAAPPLPRVSLPPPVAKPTPEPLPRPEPPPLPPPVLSKEWPGAGEAFNLVRGPRGSHWVCMTFDGGSTAEVAMDVLNALKERGIRTTFFLTGSFIQKYPELVRRMDRDGHEIGNHTMDHPHLAPRGRRDPGWTKERFQQQLLLADSLLLQLLGRPMDPYWRAPYGEQTAEIRKWAEELGYRHVYWSEGADTLDWATTKERKLYRTGNAILDRLYSRMEKDDGDGLIVLMHLGSGRPEADRPARVLGPFLDKALEEGWNFVNISAYLKESGKPRWNSTNRLATLGQAAPRQ